MRIGLWMSIVLIFFQGCGQERPVLVAPSSLEEVYEIADNANNIRSFILMKDGKVLREKYYVSYKRDSLDHLRSATKSVMANLIGIAIDQQLIKSVDDRISDYIDVPDDKKDIRVKHLLGMTSGFKWSEGPGYNDNNRMVNSGNPLKFMMDLPLVNSPGSEWNYSTGDIHLLSVILTEATGMNTQAYAKKYLFEPLGIKKWEWQKFGDGYFSGGSRLQLKPRDLLKLGILMSNRGMFNDQRILSEETHDLLTDVHNLFEDDQEYQAKAGYGYGWWTASIEGDRIFMASGYGGQTIIVAPKVNMVLVVTFKWNVGADTAIEQQQKTQDMGKMTWLWFRENE
ncbi:MAG: serine hydrolase [Bacteroidota bacterium]